jgi:hypothetical protein
MSYILEALKKTEAKRQEDQIVSRLHASQPAPPASVAGRSGTRRWLLLALLVLPAFPVGSYLYKHFTNSAALVIAPDNPEPLHKQSGAPQTEQNETIPEFRPTNIKVANAWHAGADQGDVIEPAPLFIEQRVPSLPAVDERPSVPYLEELDALFRESVPQFQLAGHVYSVDPTLRMILINNRIFREKDSVAKDFILDEITPEGIILRSGDIHFRMKGY